MRLRTVLEVDKRWVGGSGTGGSNDWALVVWNEDFYEFLFLGIMRMSPRVEFNNSSS